MADNCLLTLDAGTTSIKSVSFSTNGEVLAQAAQPTPVSRPKAGWVEQDMAETWTRAATVLRAVVEDTDGAVRAIGITGQGGGAWLIDEAGEPVRDAIIWSDGRTASYVDRYQAGGEAKTIFEKCRYELSAESPLLTYKWLSEHEPGAVDRTDTAFFCKDWVKYKLTGRRTTDHSDVCIANYRPYDGQFSTEVAALVDATAIAERLPTPEPSHAVIGHVTDRAAAETTIPSGTPVVSGSMDVVTSAFGSGAITVGECSSVIGTTLQNQVFVSGPGSARTRAGYTLDTGLDRLFLRAMGAMAGTPNLTWLAETVFGDVSLQAVEKLARMAPIGADGVMFHPYTNRAGEKAPFVNTASRGQFTGLTADHTRAHLARAVYEGVALAMRDCYASLPTDADMIYASGGGVRSRFWCQLFADCLNADILVPETEELGAKGAALLAGTGIGLYENMNAAVERTKGIERTVTPRPDAARKYSQWYDVYYETRRRMERVWALRRDVQDHWAHTE